MRRLQVKRYTHSLKYCDYGCKFIKLTKYKPIISIYTCQHSEMNFGKSIILACIKGSSTIYNIVD